MCLKVFQSHGPNSVSYVDGTYKISEILFSPQHLTSHGKRYEPGIGIAFHVDAYSAFEEGIAAVTLGSGIVPRH